MHPMQLMLFGMLPLSVTPANKVDSILDLEFQVQLDHSFPHVGA